MRITPRWFRWRSRREAALLATQVVKSQTPAQIRARATWDARCTDCNVVVAYITMLGGNEVLWCRPAQRGAAWDADWFWGLHWGSRNAWCKSRVHDIDALIRASGKVEKHARVSHAAHGA